MAKLSINKSYKVAFVSAFSLFLSNVHATAIEGVGTYTSVGNYTNCPSYCNGSSRSSDYNDDEGQTESYTSLGVNGYGSGQAYSSFVSDSFLPLLRVETSAIAHSSTSATAFAVQNFTNTGTETKTVDLNVNLHGSVSDNESGYANNYLGASIAVLSGTSLDWYPSYATLVYEIGQPLLSPMSLYISDGLDVNVFDTISFDIEAGESFFIVSNMLAGAQNGYADAWSTLSMSFLDGSNLEAALQVATSPVDVPEPETLFLLGLGLIGLLFKKQNK
ncbi:PEP-CTERM sorting domain-containing protein [Psychromonas arctica]|uniref:PEP-CTERM sorting domain-containing protein n=1 Tax=Psychromonas arctica TaxID=168275 RepID=A0ABU9HA83_9GAMM